MFKYVKQYSAVLALTSISIIFSTLFATFAQFLKGDILDYALVCNANKTILYSGLLLLFILLEIFFAYLSYLGRNKFSTSCIKHLKEDLFQSVLLREYPLFQKLNKGEYVSKFTNNAELSGNLYFSNIAILIELCTKTLIVSLALFLLNWKIAILTLVLLSTPLYIPKLLEKNLQKSQSDYVENIEQYLVKLNDWLSGFELIKNFSLEKKIFNSYVISNKNAMDTLLSNKNVNSFARIVSALISYLSYFLVLVFSGYLVIKGDFTAGKFFVAIGMIDQLSYPLIALSNQLQQFISVKPVNNELVNFMSVVNGDSNFIKKRDSVEFNDVIKYHNVSFSYAGQAVIKDFSADFIKNKKYLIKGRSGSGKTTIINLLLKYYDVNKGCITIDGKDISEVENIYKLITVVRQDAFLFNDTLRNNITMYGDVPDEEIFSVLKKVNLTNYANSTDIDKIVSENGSNFSGGERKRISLARALLRNTNILILDEPLANLDDNTSRNIENELLDINNHTLIIVSHQFSYENLYKFDEIIEIKGARNTEC